MPKAANTKAATAAVSFCNIVDTLKSAFGEHPDDVMGILRYAAETLSQLEAIFVSIEGDLDRSRSPLTHTKKMAGAGRCIAEDVANLVGCQCEKYEESLQSHGIPCGRES